MSKASKLADLLRQNFRATNTITEAAAMLRELEAKVKRLESRGIEDMQVEIASLKAERDELQRQLDEAKK